MNFNNDITHSSSRKEKRHTHMQDDDNLSLAADSSLCQRELMPAYQDHLRQ